MKSVNVRFKVFTAVTVRMVFCGLRGRVDWLAESNVSEKRAVSIFKTEVITSCLF
jgi:hypothetical protein